MFGVTRWRRRAPASSVSARRVRWRGRAVVRAMRLPSLPPPAAPLTAEQMAARNVGAPLPVMTAPVTVTAYDPARPERFAREQTRILSGDSRPRHPIRRTGRPGTAWRIRRLRLLAALPGPATVDRPPGIAAGRRADEGVPHSVGSVAPRDR